MIHALKRNGPYSGVVGNSGKYTGKNVRKLFRFMLFDSCAAPLPGSIKTPRAYYWTSLENGAPKNCGKGKGATPNGKWQKDWKDAVFSVGFRKFPKKLGGEGVFRVVS